MCLQLRYRRFDAIEARHLLTTAIDRGAPPDEALAILSLLDRLEMGSQPGEPLRLRPNAASL